MIPMMNVLGNCPKFPCMRANISDETIIANHLLTGESAFSSDGTRKGAAAAVNDTATDTDTSVTADAGTSDTETTGTVTTDTGTSDAGTTETA